MTKNHEDEEEFKQIHPSLVRWLLFANVGLILSYVADSLAVEAAGGIVAVVSLVMVLRWVRSEHSIQSVDGGGE